MRVSKIVAVLLVLLLLLAGCGSPQQSANTADTKSAPVSDGGDLQQQPSQNPTPEPPQTTDKTSGNLKIHFLDVGQADSILVQFPNSQSMLVDAGNNADDLLLYLT